MVFLVDRNGVPSIAPILRVKPDDETAIPPRVTQSSQVSRDWGASEAFDGDTGHTTGATGSVFQTRWKASRGGRSTSAPAATSRASRSRCAQTPARRRATSGSSPPISPSSRSASTRCAPSPASPRFTSRPRPERRHRDAAAHRPLHPRAGARYERSLSLAEVTPERPYRHPAADHAVGDCDRYVDLADQPELGRPGQRDRLHPPARHLVGVRLADDRRPAGELHQLHLNRPFGVDDLLLPPACQGRELHDLRLVDHRLGHDSGDAPAAAAPTPIAERVGDLDLADQPALERPGDNETGYTLQRSRSLSFSSPTTVNLAPTDELHRDRARRSTIYYFRLRAKNGAVSAWSATASARTGRWSLRIW